MKIKKIAALLASAALVANMLVMAAAHADTSSSNPYVGVTAGGLTIASAPASQSFGSVTYASTNQTLADVAVSGAIETKDFRGTGADYYLKVQATDYTTGASSIDVTNMSVKVASTADASGGSAGSCSTGFTLTSSDTALTDADDNGTSDQQDLFAASGQDPYTHCNTNMEVDLVIPAYTVIETYTSTMTLELI